MPGACTRVWNDSRARSLNRRIPDFNHIQLAKAIATRDRSYRLLLWISDAIDQGYIQPSRAAHHSGEPHAATEWLRKNYHRIPEECRPQENDIDEFAAFFSTYLTSSFDVIENPGTKGEGPTAGYCQCEICRRIVNAPHLRAKKLSARDKRRADVLIRQSLTELAAQNDLDLADGQAEKILTNPDTKRQAAYIAYGHWLVRRLSGDSDGPAILALWRLIAWDPRGGIRRGFKLKLEDFILAENNFISTMKIVG